MAQVVALVDDLFFQAKMTETARRLGIDLKTVGTGEALIEEVTRMNPALIIVDLNAQHSPLEAIERLRAASKDAKLIAYLSHVHVELAERARAAGCNEVMPRSKFTQNLATILAQAKS